MRAAALYLAEALPHSQDAQVQPAPLFPAEQPQEAQESEAPHWQFLHEQEGPQVQEGRLQRFEFFGATA